MRRGTGIRFGGGLALALVVLGWVALPVWADAPPAADRADVADGEHGEGGHGDWIPSVYWAAPFLVMLVIVAVFPLLPKVHHWWHHNTNRFLVSCILGIPVIWVVWAHDPHRVEHTAIEYFSFIVLLGTLFVAAGGLHLTGDLRATPTMNTGFLALGYLLASIIGTTGASMLLIYPLLRTNSERKNVMHVFIFFIFLVSNTGGLLTPIGDPPLFLGYLRGVSFFWFMKLLPMWLANGIVLLGLFWILDRWYYGRETRTDVRSDDTHIEPVRLLGIWNILFLFVIVGSVVASKSLEGVCAAIFGEEWAETHGATPVREGVMILAAVVSLLYARRSPVAADARTRNRFSFHAIQEVAAVFFGIFATMMPALILLNARGGELMNALGGGSPMIYFYATGIFSSFLDNAPTFVCFLELAQGAGGKLTTPDMMGTAVNPMLGYAPALILGAVSLGAVFMGAMTYIGNAPNFMVRAICEEQGIKMPNFFGFMLWAVVILIPVFSLIAYVFLVKLPFPLF